MKLTNAQKAVLLRHYDRTVGGAELVSADYRPTLDALEQRGLVGEVSMPRWLGGPHTASLTATGLAERERLESERPLPVEGDDAP